MKKKYEKSRISFLELKMEKGLLASSILIDDNQVTVDEMIDVTSIDGAGNETDYFDVTLF